MCQRTPGRTGLARWFFVSETMVETGSYALDFLGVLAFNLGVCV